MEVPKTDLLKFITYLKDAAPLYDALALPSMMKIKSRSHMIHQLTDKYDQKLQTEQSQPKQTDPRKEKPA